MHMRSPVICAAVAAVLSFSSVIAASPYPTRDTPAAKDMGPITAKSTMSTMTLTLPLKLRDAAGADALLQSISTKSSADYHRFLTPSQFRARFGASDDDVASAVAYFAAQGLKAERVGALSLRVTGSPAKVQRLFKVTLHDYLVAAHGATSAFHFQAPTTAATIPAEVSGVVAGVVGLSTRPEFAPHKLKGFARQSVKEVSTSSDLINQFGSLTVADFDKQYDVAPLAAKGITGKGRTIGIVTLAPFTPRDAFAYWKAVGLTVNPNRITIYEVDGDNDKPSDAAGSDETTLDVEQSGGIAPGADIIVYQARNTDQGYLDAFFAAVESNKADSISTSWGAWEWFYNLANSPVTDPYTGETVSELAAFHEVFLQAALQGQTMFAAAGDAGAYDVNRFNAPPDYSLALSVDFPASDSYITAAGGTTLPGKQVYTEPAIVVNIPKERVWSWDYLIPLCDSLNLTPLDCGIFPVGGGGGVSFEYALPFYQVGVSGLQKTAPDQSFVYEDTIPPTTILDLPANYAGRNVPDISANADPDTGYVIYYTSDKAGFELETFYGGTSFVGPQLNGVMGLIGQYLQTRVGLLNVPLYELQKGSGAYTGKAPPFNVIDSGNNDYYGGRDGYSPGAGIGTLDVSNFAEALKQTF